MRKMKGKGWTATKRNGRSEISPHGVYYGGYSNYYSKVGPEPTSIINYHAFNKLKKDYPKIKYSVYPKHKDLIKVLYDEDGPNKNLTNEDVLTESNLALFKGIFERLGTVECTLYCWKEPFFISAIFCNENWILEDDLEDIVGIAYKEKPILIDIIENIPSEKIAELLKTHDTLVFRDHAFLANAHNAYRPLIYINGLDTKPTVYLPPPASSPNSAINRNRNTVTSTQTGISIKKIKRSITQNNTQSLPAKELSIYYALKWAVDQEFPILGKKYPEIDKYIELLIQNKDKLAENRKILPRVNQKLCEFYLKKEPIIEVVKRQEKNNHVNKGALNKVVRKIITERVKFIINTEPATS